MIQSLPPSEEPLVEYPDSDGEPIAENTLQFEWIVTIKGNLDALFGDDPAVFVAGDLLWYPVEGVNTIRQAPDAMVVFGRPKGHRGSYRQWEEGGIAPQVVFEILSPGNRAGELQRKLDFYHRYGVEEYYIYDPDRIDLVGYRREGGQLRSLSNMDGWISPRLNVRFDMSGPELVVWRPDNRPFATFLETQQQRAHAERQAKEAQRQTKEAQRQTKEAQRQTKEAQRQAKEAQRQAKEAQRQAKEAQRQTEEAQQRAARLAAQLRALGIDPDAQNGQTPS